MYNTKDNEDEYKRIMVLVEKEHDRDYSDGHREALWDIYSGLHELYPYIFPQQTHKVY